MTNTASINERMVNVETTNENTVLETILAARYFVPIASSVGALLLALSNGASIMAAIGIVLMFIGGIAAITVCPLKLLSLPFKGVVIGFTVCRGFIPFYGVADLCAAIFGTVFGFMGGLMVAACAPAIFTISKFYN